jgi:hypothetical protein
MTDKPKLIKVHVEPCPRCGRNDWWMFAPAPEARKAGSQDNLWVYPFQVIGGVLWTVFSGAIRFSNLLLFAFAKALGPKENVPSEPDSLLCAHCGYDTAFASD